MGKYEKFFMLDDLWEELEKSEDFFQASLVFLSQN
jgi:hypothetical protein